MIDLSPIIHWYTIINVQLAVSWCFFYIITFILGNTKFRTNHNNLLHISRILFIFILLAPIFSSYWSSQAKIEVFPAIETQILSFRQNFLSGNAINSGSKLSAGVMERQSLISEFNSLYLIGFVFTIAIFIRTMLIANSWRGLSKLVRSGHPWKVSGKLRIILSEQTKIPFSTLLLGRYHIVIPTTMLAEPNDLKVAIRHEGIHHRHGDTAWLLFMECIKLIFCFNPFVFFWTRSFETLQENACDETMLKQPGISLKRYGACLIRLCQSIADFDPHIIAVSSIFQKPIFLFKPNTRLERRIKMMSHQKKIRFPVLKSFVLITPLVAIVLTLSAALNVTLLAENKGTTDVKPMKDIAPEIISRVYPDFLPVQGRLTSGYGMRKDPFTSKNAFHKGVDISNKIGTPIVSPLDGIVIFAERKGAYGLRLDIDHGNNIITHYSNLSKILVKVGTKISKGQKVALLGNSGKSTGPHLHYELMVDGQRVDPFKYIKD